ncbi:hypothetical protein CTI12_AA247530 [Artemisia annua]|uniref:Uncharacterized protein n=1 Tax=Artemisia annua TaxID=35608 RepID=A0A2U1NND1_ARTAN|nr:hypothetical protein CTI12_AA247530 [Artemisia annua]
MVTPPVPPPVDQNTLNNNDPLYLASSDHPAMRWVRCDYMVTCWILNSMVTELSDAFLYAQSACELWKEIAERYGQSNGPLIYQLERELSKITQGNLSIAAFFNKLKRCWDELQNLNGLPVCNCGKMLECTCAMYEKFLERDSHLKLIQFLMKLNDEYESVRSQILSMDPLPNVNKAYYIVQQIEKTETAEVSEFHASFSFNKPVVNNVVNSEAHLDLHTFHARLGHTSLSKLVHIPLCKTFDVSTFSCESFANPQFVPEFPNFGEPVPDDSPMEVPNSTHNPVPETVTPNTPLQNNSSQPQPEPNTHDASAPPPQPQNTRKSTRNPSKPAWLKDFITSKGSTKFVNQESP